MDLLPHFVAADARSRPDGRLERAFGTQFAHGTHALGQIAARERHMHRVLAPENRSQFGAVQQLEHRAGAGKPSQLLAPACGAMRPATSDMGVSKGSVRFADVTVS